MKETFQSFLMVINTSFSVLVSAQLYKVKFLQTIKSKKELFVGFKYKKVWEYRIIANQSFWIPVR